MRVHTPEHSSCEEVELPPLLSSLMLLMELSSLPQVNTIEILLVL